MNMKKMTTLDRVRKCDPNQKFANMKIVMTHPSEHKHTLTVTVSIILWDKDTGVCIL